MVAAVVKRSGGFIDAAVGPMMKRQISLITKIIRLDFPNQAEKIPCSPAQGIPSQGTDNSHLFGPNIR
jgi:hypothetical protein